MDEISKSVAQNVKTGQYFSDARKWYTHKYIYTVTERSVLMFIFFITLIAFLVVLYVFNALFPMEKEVPFIIQVKDSIEYRSIIKPLAEDSNNSQEAITRYLISNYIISYESYAYKDIEKHAARIKSTSLKRIFKEYANYMSTTNYMSPLIIYQKSATRTVKILSIVLQQDTPETGKAVVQFEATVEDRARKIKTSTTYNANISFIISDVNTSTNKESFEFLVTNYQTQQIK